MNKLIMESGKPVWAFAPADLNGAGAAADYVSMKKGGRLLIILVGGAWAGGTPAFTLFQATNNAGAGAKALNFDRYWHATGLTNDDWTEVAVAANTFNLTNAANKIYAVEVMATHLDTNNGFTHVNFTIADPAAASVLGGVYIVGELDHESYPTEQETMID